MKAIPAGASELESVACALCGANDAQPVLTTTDIEFDGREAFTIVACRHCGLRFLNPRPTPAAIGRHYPAAYYTHHLLDPLEEERIYRQPLRLVDRWAPEGPLLDIGAGDGGFLAALARRARPDLHGLEADPAAWQVASTSRGLDVALGSFPDVLPAGRDFATVVMLETIEHLHRPLEALQAIHDRLAPGGRLIISTPNIQGLEFRLLGRSSVSLQVPRHLTFFDPASLSAACHQTGLKVLHLETSAATDGFTRSLWLAARRWVGTLRRRPTGPTAAAATFQPHSWRRRMHQGLDAALSPIGPLLAARKLGPTLFLVAERPT